jgi:hypothetical protein
VHVTALDGVVNVNSLFTVAVFVGLSLAGDPSCDAGPGVARSLLVLEVVAFSSFLFSSLVAQGLKLALNLINSKDPHDALRAHIDVRLGMLASAVVGCVFLMVMVVQIRLCTLGCATNRAAAKAAAGLVGLVTTALAVYIGTVFYTFTALFVSEFAVDKRHDDHIFLNKKITVISMWCFPCHVGAEPVLWCRTTLVLDRGARGILGRGPDTLTSPLLKSPAVDECAPSLQLMNPMAQCRCSFCIAGPTQLLVK